MGKNDGQKSEVSRNVLLIALAVRLQRLVKNLPNDHISAERISHKSLAESYFHDGLSDSSEGARKKAGRYMDEMERVFGLRGSESTGYVMAQKFEKFRDMFQWWLEKISPPGSHDKRLHVMLNGLIHAIDNAFSEDPIVIPELARQLKEKYGNKNVRDTRKPLSEMFDNHYIASWLQLIEMDENGLAVATDMDPLLLRLKPKSAVDDNHDASIKLARPGRIHTIFEQTLNDLNQIQLAKVRDVATSVCKSVVWEIDRENYLPYILYREGKNGEVMLTMRNLTRNNFKDISIDETTDIPAMAREYTPYNIDEGAWNSFRQIVR